jgi:hypothetical protein
VGFQQPLVVLWDPEAIRALYANHEHGLPVGRTVALLPILGPLSPLLLEGREHLAAGGSCGRRLWRAHARVRVDGV